VTEPLLRKDRVDLSGALMLGGFSVLMGVNHTMVKVVNEGMAPILQAGVRSAIAFPVVLAFALIARRRLSLSDGTFWPGLFCGLLFAAEFLALFLALDRTTVGRVAVLFYTMPFWVALAAHFLIPGERLTPRRVVGLVLALGGVALALGSAEEGGGSLAGDLLSLFAAACWAGIALTARLTRLSTASVEMQLLYQLGVASIVLLALAPLESPLIRDLVPAHLWMIVFQAVVIIAMGFLMWFWILKVYPASDMAAFGFLSPLFAMLFGWAALGEPLTAELLGAMALVGAGIFLVAWKPRRGIPPA
jgi:drug/metabolite transporter (DMT)-like permease